MAALELLRKAASDGDLDIFKEGVAVLAQLVMDAEVSGQIGAAHGERAPQRRLSQRNGYRERRPYRGTWPRGDVAGLRGPRQDVLHRPQLSLLGPAATRRRLAASRGTMARPARMTSA